MRLQDELQAEVDRVREEQAAEEARRLAQLAFYREYLHQPMLGATRYFTALTRKLAVVAPDIKVAYPLDPHRPEGLSLRQSNYRMLVDNSEEPRRIDILCSCELSRPHEFYVATGLAADNRAKLLNTYGIPFHRKNKLDKFYNICGGTFILEGPITARIRITALPAHEVVEVEIRNLFPDPEPRTYRFTPHQLDEDLMEKLAKFMLRQVPHIVDTAVDDVYRDQLRSKLAQDELARQEEMAAAALERDRERIEAEQARLGNRVKRKLAELGEQMGEQVKRGVDGARAAIDSKRRGR